MTHTTPPSRPTAHGAVGTERPDWEPTVPGGGRQRGLGRMIFLTLTGIVALAVGSVGGYLVASAMTGGPGPVACSEFPGTQCVPNVEGDAVIQMLEEHGFTCELECELHVGDTWYRARVGSHDRLLSGYKLDVHHDPALELGPRTMGFLTWFAALPFTDDPEAEAVSGEWLSENIGADQEATIRGYTYRLGTSQEAASGVPGDVTRDIVQLQMQATPDQGNPFTEQPE